MKLTRITIVIAVVLITILTIVLGFKPATGKIWTVETKVYDALREIGEPLPSWHLNYTPEMVKQGYEIIHEGRTTGPDGSKSKYVSLYYMCTNCHNTVIEDPLLTVSNPETRLQYAALNKIPVLQGTTFYGIVNRESWYNDDYYKKYGALVEPTRNNIREAIQLCAMECSQGRRVENWEIEAMLAYYYSIGYTFADLGYTDADLMTMNNMKQNPEVHGQMIQDIKSRYNLKSPATFVEPPYSRDWQTAPKGNPELGKQFYELSCQACHKPESVSDVVFDDSKANFKYMAKQLKKNYWWLYEIVRHGTHPEVGHREYMPLYPTERMSDQQIEDLKAYIEQQAH